MSSAAEMMEEIEVNGRLRDGGVCTIRANKMHADRLCLEGGLYHPFERSDGTVIMYILEDGCGNVFTSPSNRKGVSLPAQIWKRKNVVSYIDQDPFNNTMANFDIQKEVRRKKRDRGYRM